MSEQITVNFKFFAYSREIVGEKNVEREIEKGMTAREAADELMEEHPELEEYKEQIILAVNKSTGMDDKILEDGDEIAMLPPVSGG